MRVPSQAAQQRIISPLARKESIKSFCASSTIPLPTTDSFEAEDEVVDSAPLVDFVWTPTKVRFQIHEVQRNLPFISQIFLHRSV